MDQETKNQNILQLIQDHPERRHNYLEYVLDIHQFEVNDETFEKGCYYCRDVITGRSSFLEHLYNKHFLALGKIENLVFIDELLQLVEEKIKSLVCLYCEKHFRDRKTLKEHMRKKGHKRINPENRFYDKYFLINYYKSRHDREDVNGVNESSLLRRSRMYQGYAQRQSNRTQRETKSPDSKGDMLDELVDSDSDWSVWETDSNLPITCLFCLHSETSINEIKIHMIQAHSFDLDTIISKLNFYQKIKFVNYTRRQIQLKQCINCDFRVEVEDPTVKESALEILLEHMTTFGHFSIDDSRRYNQPQYFFPTVEEDPFLYFLEDTYEDSDDSSNVICEDMKAQLNVNAEIFIAENFLKDSNF